MTEDREELLRQAIAAEENDDPQRAIRLLESAVSAHPSDTHIRAWLGALYADREQYAAAIEVLEGAIALDSHHARSHAVLAEVLLALQRFAEAETAARRSLESSPKPTTYVVLGVAQSAQGQRADAVASFRRAIDLDSRNEEAMYNLALELRDTAPAEALDLFEAAIRLDRTYWDAYREYGFQLARANELGRAEAALREAIAGNSSDSIAHVYLGNVVASQGRLTEAEANLQRARELSPVAALPYWTLANVYEAQGRTADAAAFYRRAAELEPHDSTAAFQLARFLSSQGQQAEALVWVNRVLELEPGHEGALQLKHRP